METELGVFTSDLSLLLLLLLPDNSSFVPLRSLLLRPVQEQALLPG